MSFYIFNRHRVCLVDHVDLICSLYSWWESFGSSSLATLPLGFNCGFTSTSTSGLSTGIQFLRLPWRTWVCPCEGQVWRWCTCFCLRISGSTTYSGELAARAAGNIVLQKGILPGKSHGWRSLVGRLRTRLSDFTFTFHFHALEKEMATHSSVLAWRIPGTGEPVGLPSMGSHRVGHD